MKRAGEWIYQVEVTNWPEPSGQGITIALAAASLIVSVVALITSVASLRWMKESWRREGAELKIEFSFSIFEDAIQKYLGDPTFKLRARNSGRAMTEINWVFIWALKGESRDLVALRSGEDTFGDDKRFVGGQQCTVNIGFDALFPKMGIEKLNTADSVRLEVMHTFGSESKDLSSQSMEQLRRYLTSLDSEIEEFK